jgi:hypothetical protein
MTKLAAVSRGRFAVSRGGFEGAFASRHAIPPHFARFRAEHDGEEPWSEDDLFGLESALAFAGSIEEIAIFLGREVKDVRRKASERGWPTR